MANSLLKLTVESSEYDAKLKKAAEGVRHLADVAHKSAGDMTGLEQSTLDYIKSIGEMETKSRSAAGQVRELESTYKELKVIYDQLNDVEKADEGGKALAASLEQLKQRAQDAKKSLDDASKSLNDNDDASKKDSNSISDLTSKLGINIKSLVGWGAALGAAKMALDVMKDALFQSENNVDEWGRTIAASESVYTGFLNALNSGDFSGFLNNLSNIVSSAKEAYNALDELGTRMTIINPERAKLQARQQELRATIRTKGADSAEGKAAQKELQNMQSQITASYGKESQMNKNAFEALVRQRLQEGGINLTGKSFDQFMKTFSDDNAFQQLRRGAKGSIGYQNYVGASKKVDNRNTNQKLLDLFTDEWRQQNSGYLTAAYNAQGAAASNALGNARYNRVKTTGDKTGKTIQQQRDEAEMTGKDKGPDLDKMFPDHSEQNYNTGYVGSKQARQDGMNADYGMALENIGNAPINTQSLQTFISEAQSLLQQADLGSDLYTSLTEKLADTSTMSAVLQGAIAGGVQGADLTAVADEMKQKLLEGDITDEALQEFLDRLNEKIEDSDLKLTFDVDTKTIETAAQKNKKETAEMAKEWQAAGSAIQAVGQAMSQIEDPAAKVLGTIAQAVATMALSYAQAANSKAVTSTGWGWIAFAATGVATMLSSIAAIKNATSGFANGGIVPGNSYSGDNLRTSDFGINSGELILNKSQQNNLASQLEGNGMQGYSLETRVNGRDLVIVMNNDGTARGRGELVRTNRRG